MNAETAPLSVEINGSVSVLARHPDLTDIDPVLRGVAQSLSPVLIRGDDTDCIRVAKRIHALGRNQAQPVHICRSPDEAQSLFCCIESDGVTRGAVVGTWALYGVDSWPRELQINLNKVLEALDEGRLHGRLRAETIPRILVMTEERRGASTFEPELLRRLSYFHVTTGPETPKKAKR